MDTNCVLSSLVFTGVTDQNIEITVVPTIKKSPKLFREAQAVVHFEHMVVVHIFSCKYLKQLKVDEDARPNMKDLINSLKVTNRFISF